jgi:type VI secretion system secreted protein Hcp
MYLALALAAATGCLIWCTSCGSGSRAVAAPALQVPGALSHRVRLRHADGREATMEIYGWSHEVVSPRDAASGLPTGKRQHKPFRIIKSIDATTPLLMRTLLDETQFALVTIESERSSYGGARETYIKVEMENVSVVGSLVDRPEGLGLTGDPEVLEAVSFDYQTIRWTWADGSTAQDTWLPAR